MGEAVEGLHLKSSFGTHKKGGEFAWRKIELTDFVWGKLEKPLQKIIFKTPNIRSNP